MIDDVVGTIDNVLEQYRCKKIAESVLSKDVQRLFVFDCCRASLEQQYRYNSLPTIISETFPGIIPPIILSGCSSGQYAWEAAEGGIFTKALLDELPKANSFEDFIEWFETCDIDS